MLDGRLVSVALLGIDIVAACPVPTLVDEQLAVGGVRYAISYISGGNWIGT